MQTIIESYHEDLEAMSAELSRVLQVVHDKEQSVTASESTVTDLRSKMSSLEGQLRARSLEALSQLNEARGALQRKDAELAEALTLASELNKERGTIVVCECFEVYLLMFSVLWSLLRVCFPTKNASSLHVSLLLPGRVSVCVLSCRRGIGSVGAASHLI